MGTYALLYVKSVLDKCYTSRPQRLYLISLGVLAYSYVFLR